MDTPSRISNRRLWIVPHADCPVLVVKSMERDFTPESSLNHLRIEPAARTVQSNKINGLMIPSSFVSMRRTA
jgi:hypothetical protein